MPEQPPRGCPFHRGLDTASQSPEVTPGGVFQYAHQVHATTICPGLGNPDFICTHGLIALKQGRVLAFDYRNLSGEVLWNALLEGVREYVCGKYDNFVMTLPETEFLSLRDTQCSVMDFYTVLQTAFNRVAVELCAYRDLQELHHVFTETVAQLLTSANSTEKLKRVLTTEPYKSSLQKALDNPKGTFQTESVLIRQAAEECKKDPNSQIELLQIIQLTGTYLTEGKLHSFYMGPSLEDNRIRHNPHHIIVLTKASSFNPTLLASQTSDRIRMSILREEVDIVRPLMVKYPGMAGELFYGNKVFGAPFRIPLSQYFELPVKSSRPTDSLLPKIRNDIKQTPKLSVVAIEGGFQIGEDVFLIDQSEFPKTKITYKFQGKEGVCIIRETPDFYEDMKDGFKLFCSTKVACIYQKISIVVTGKVTECATVFTVMRDVENNLK